MMTIESCTDVGGGAELAGEVLLPDDVVFDAGVTPPRFGFAEQSSELCLGQGSGQPPCPLEIASNPVLCQEFLEMDQGIASLCTEPSGKLNSKACTQLRERRFQLVAAHATVAGARALRDAAGLDDDDRSTAFE